MFAQLTIYKERLKHSPLFKDSFWALLGSVLGKGLSLLAGVMVPDSLAEKCMESMG